MKKSYKLIKEYPGSVTEGTIFVADNEINAVFQTKGGCAVIYWQDLEKYSEYFEEVKEEPFIQQSGRVDRIKEELNYLITAFREINVNQNIFSLQKDGRYNNSNHSGGLKLETMLKGFASLEDGVLEIYSVKNSKGEEFTIGDNVFFLPKNSLELFKIDNFFINGDGILLARSSQERCAICEDINTITKEIKVPHKAKSPIYTTTDGTEIQEGQDVDIWVLNKDTTFKASGVNNIKNFSKQDKEVADRYLTFTSEENRDKYIKENSKKPVLIATDGKEIFEGDTIYHFYKPFEYMMHKSIVRHNTIYGDVIFYTEEKAKEYIDFNKPKYSLANIEKCYPTPTGYENRIKDIPVVATLFSNLKKLGK